MHADGGDQHVQHRGADLRRTRAFHLPRAGEAEQQADRGGNHHHPEEGGSQAEFFQLPFRRQCLDPFDQRRGEEMRQARRTQADAQDDHQVGQRGIACVLRVIVLHALAQVVDDGGIGAHPAVDLRRARDQEQEERHPHVRDEDVDRDELAEQGGIDREDFLHRRLVGTTADPTARERGHAAPGITGHGLRMDDAQCEEGHHGTQHNACRTGQEHDDRLGAQPQYRDEINGDAEQRQRAGQHVVARHRVQAGRVAIDQAETVVDRRQQIAHQECRHDGVELLPGAGRTRGAPEHEGQRGGQQAHHDGVVLDQCGGWCGGFDRHRSGLPCGLRKRRWPARGRPSQDAQRPMCCFSQALTVSCHRMLFCGLSTQWFSSGKYSSLDSMPLRCSAVNVDRPWSTGTR